MARSRCHVRFPLCLLPFQVLPKVSLLDAHPRAGRAKWSIALLLGICRGVQESAAEDTLQCMLEGRRGPSANFVAPAMVACSSCVRVVLYLELSPCLLNKYVSLTVVCMCCIVCVANCVLCVATCISKSVPMCSLCQAECSNDCLRVWCFRVLAKAVGRGDGEDEELRSNFRTALCTRLSSRVCSACLFC